MTNVGRAQRDGVAIEVSPGGALESVRLEPGSLRLGGSWLAGTILALVREATDKADRAAQQAVSADLAGLTAEELTVLGFARVEGEEAGRQ